VSAQAKRSELDDDIGQQLSDCNPPLPCLLALFSEADAIEAAFTEEADGMLEVTPEPNLIVPLIPLIRRAFVTPSTCSEWPARPLRQPAGSLISCRTVRPQTEFREAHKAVNEKAMGPTPQLS